MSSGLQGRVWACESRVGSAGVRQQVVGLLLIAIQGAEVHLSDHDSLRELGGVQDS